MLLRFNRERFSNRRGSSFEIFDGILAWFYLSEATMQISSDAPQIPLGMADGRRETTWDLNTVLLSQTATKAFRSGWSWDEIASESPEIYAPRGFSLLPQPNILSLSPRLFSRPLPLLVHPLFRLDFLPRKWIFMKDINNERDNFLSASYSCLQYKLYLSLSLPLSLCTIRNFPSWIL